MQHIKKKKPPPNPNNSMKFLRCVQEKKQFRSGYEYFTYTSFCICSLTFAHNVRVWGTAIISMLYPASLFKVICSYFCFLKAITLYSGPGRKSKQKTDEAEPINRQA